MAVTASGARYEGIRQTSALGNCSPPYVRRLALDGLIRSVLPPDGGPRLYCVDDLLALMDKKRELLANA